MDCITAPCMPPFGDISGMFRTTPGEMMMMMMMNFIIVSIVL